jgi:hypothetical protein
MRFEVLMVEKMLMLLLFWVVLPCELRETYYPE